MADVKAEEKVPEETVANDDEVSPGRRLAPTVDAFVGLLRPVSRHTDALSTRGILSSAPGVSRIGCR